MFNMIVKAVPPWPSKVIFLLDLILLGLQSFIKVPLDVCIQVILFLSLVLTLQEMIRAI